MKTVLTYVAFFVSMTGLSSARAYISLSPVEVHSRLVRGDTLLLLDVREVDEYTAGHVAEPVGQLPLTPVNMPWTSGVLSAEYHRLAENTDILVYCRSGGRSAAASAFLESHGFTRIHNMTGGFSSWTFESRDRGYGDHSGRWVRSFDLPFATITSTETGETSTLQIPPTAFPETDSAYIELHFVTSSVRIPPDVPLSDIRGLFRLTVLDRFGLSRFAADSLVLAGTARISLYPEYGTDAKTAAELRNLSVFVPGRGWRDVSFEYRDMFFHREETILRRWYNAEGFFSTGIAESTPDRSEGPIYLFPNPFNGSLKIAAPQDAEFTIYDLNGRTVHRTRHPVWTPDRSVPSGTYFVAVSFGERTICKKILYLK